MKEATVTQRYRGSFAGSIKQSTKAHIENELKLLENKLQDKVNSLFSNILNASEAQPLQLPALNGNNYSTNNNNNNQSTQRNSYYTTTEHGRRSKPNNQTASRTRKSQSVHNNLEHSTRNALTNGSLVDSSLISHNESSRRIAQDHQSYSFVAKTETIPQGRAIGNKLITKPKFEPLVKANILPKHLRNNPFANPIPVSVNDINKGVYGLLNRGVIGKDIDISTAFERGEPPIRSKGAVLHNFEEKVVKDLLTIQNSKAGEKSVGSLPKNMNNDNQKETMRAGWALTELNIQSKRTPNSKQAQQEIIETYSKKPNNTMLTTTNMQCIHIEFRNNAVYIVGSAYVEAKQIYHQNWGAMAIVLKSIEKLLKKYCIGNAYADAQKILSLSFSLVRVREDSLWECLVGGLKQKQMHKSISKIGSYTVKLQIATLMLGSFLMMMKERSGYLRDQKKKGSQFKIVSWIKQKILHRKLQKELEKRTAQQADKSQALQRQLVQNFDKIKSQKHYEIHVPNIRFDKSKQVLVQKLNVEITRIFAVREPNVHIIYICPFQLAADITNYYYKILQLGQIQNFRDRITFLDSDPSNFFKLRFSPPQTLFYMSSTLKKIKDIIKDHPSYLVTGVPQRHDIKLSAYLGVPVFANHDLSSYLNNRAHSFRKIKQLEAPYLPSFVIESEAGQKTTMGQLLTKMSRLSQQTKCRRLIMKINGTCSGTGVALVTLPVINLEDLYSKTVPAHARYYPEPRQFYIDLLSKGGIVERHESNCTSVSASILIKPDKSFEVLGTFDKICNGFTVVAYSFPQQTLRHQDLITPVQNLVQQFSLDGYYGYLSVGLLVDSQKQIFVNEIVPYLTESTCSLFYFKYLMGGRLEQDGKYYTSIQDVTEEPGESLEAGVPRQSVSTHIEPRNYLYCPFILHFGLSQMQIKNFFQLCRIEGVSFDLQKKYGSTFILIDTLKSSIGLLTTGRGNRISYKLMVLTLGFLLKQNHKSAVDPVKEKEIKYREKCNIVSVKGRIEESMQSLKNEGD